MTNSQTDKSLDKLKEIFMTFACDVGHLDEDVAMNYAIEAITTLKQKCEREARIDELKSSLDKLIVQEGKLYKMFKSKSQEDKNICVGVKLMADRVSCLYDRIKELGDSNECKTVS